MRNSIGFIPQQIKPDDYEIYEGECIKVRTNLAKLEGLVERVSNGKMLLKLDKDSMIISSGSNTATIETKDISVIAPSVILYGPNNKPIYRKK